MYKDIIAGVVAFLVSYYILKYFLMKRQRKVDAYEKELVKVLNDDEFKVKGRFE